jgi:hypothetical protein
MKHALAADAVTVGLPQQDVVGYWPNRARVIEALTSLAQPTGRGFEANGPRMTSISLFATAISPERGVQGSVPLVRCGISFTC